MSQHKTPEFKKLQEQWYKKLKKSGFKDIEQNEDRLMVWDSTEFQKNYSEIKFKARESYYRMAEHFLTNHKFTSEAERYTWQLHSEGKSIREIIKLMRARGFKAYMDLVWGRIKTLRQIMLRGTES